MSFRKLILQATILAIAGLYGARLVWLQLLDDSLGQRASKQYNKMRRIVPPRGLIYDRNGKAIVTPRIVFNLRTDYRKLKIADTAAFCQKFNIPLENLRINLGNARKHHDYNHPLRTNISLAEYQRFQELFILAPEPGLKLEEQTIRHYPDSSMAHALGYVRELDSAFLAKDSLDVYRQGDYVGKSGIEAYYEQYLHGKPGTEFVITDNRQRKRGYFRPPVPAESGMDLTTTVDIDLQKYAEKLMRNKVGAVVAIEPKTGEILVMLSAPTYDPNRMSGIGSEVNNEYARLLRDPLKPLFNRATMSPYPPGSTYKTLMALSGLKDGVLDTVNTRFSCIKSLVGCHNHPGPLDVFGSIQHSCNPFYYQAFRKIVLQKRADSEMEDAHVGLDSLKRRLETFGLGIELPTDLPYVNSGRVPSDEYYSKYHWAGENWKLPNIQSIAIGQGEVGVIPLQLANVSAAIANRGWYITPHLVKDVGGQGPLPQFTEKHYVDADEAHLDYVARAMAEVTRAGTARLGYIDNELVVCGKTGTAQNPHGEDHSVFMSFAPLNDPQIAIAVYVENAGFGGTWAAPIASLLIEKHIRGDISRRRKWVEQYVLDGDLIEKERLRKEREARRNSTNSPARAANNQASSNDDATKEETQTEVEETD